jgi:hypothetical protein
MPGAEEEAADLPDGAWRPTRVRECLSPKDLKEMPNALLRDGMALAPSPPKRSDADGGRTV